MTCFSLSKINLFALFYIGIYLVWSVIACFLTFISWTIGIIPTDENDKTLEFAPFFVMADYRFVMMISFPYLFVLGIVFTCDCIALLIAIMRRKRLSDSPNLTKQQFTFSLSYSKGGDDPENSPTTNQTKQLNLSDLKLSIRCLSLTTWYFVSQISIFLPGVLMFGCDFKDVSM